MTSVTAQADTRTSRATAIVVAGLAAWRLALSVPYAAMGPGLFMDDWWVLRNIRFDGVWAGAGHRQALARPGAWLLFNVEFGVIGRHPLLLYGVMVAVNVGVTVALFFALRRLVGCNIAAAIAAVHAVLPNHATLDRWPSTIGIVTALALALWGVAAVARAYDEDRSLWPAALLFVAGALCYEAVLVIAGLALVAVPLVRRRRVRWPHTVASLSILAVVGAWMLAHSQKELPSGRRFADLSLLWPGHFGRGIAVDDDVGRWIVVIATALIVFAVARLLLPGMRRDTGTGERLVVAGVAVVFIGALPFLEFPITVLGVNDRANVVSGLGSATVWVGLALVLRRWPAALGVFALGWLLVIGPTRWQRDRDWAAVGDRARVTVADVASAFPSPSDEIVIGPAADIRHGVVALVSDWDTSAAVQLQLGDPLVIARVAADEREFCRSTTPFAWDAERRAPGRSRCR